MRNIEEEYANHEMPDDIELHIQDSFQFILSVEQLIKRLERDQRKILVRIVKNGIEKKIFFTERDLLQAEGDCLGDMDDIIDDNLNILLNVLESLTEDNYKEMMKMVDFLFVHYLENKGYIAGRIEALNQSVGGITYQDCRFEYTHPAVKDFLEKKLEEMKKKKQLEKSKEI